MRTRRTHPTWPFGDLTPHSYGVVIADPPWHFDTWSRKGITKGAEAQYDCMSLDEIKALPVQQLVRPDALLLLWTTGWAMAEGYARELAIAWGAKPITEIIWCKITKNHLARWGTGYRVRSLHEPVLVCTWGRPKHKALPSRIDGLAREHSMKPDEFYAAVNKATRRLLYRCDLFSAGVERDGFESWGADHRLQEIREARAAAFRDARAPGQADGVEQYAPGSGGGPLAI